MFQKSEELLLFSYLDMHFYLSLSYFRQIKVSLCFPLLLSAIYGSKYVLLHVGRFMNVLQVGGWNPYSKCLAFSIYIVTGAKTSQSQWKNLQ